MKTVYIAGLRQLGEAAAKAAFEGTTKLAIGVKNGAYDIDEITQIHPQVKIVKRFPEVVNGNYVEEVNSPESHILQPAILKWEDTPA